MQTLKYRLNPFLFSPDTNFRFILLIVSVLGAGLFAYYNLYGQVHRQELVSGLLKCLSDAESVFPLDGFEPNSPEYINQSFSNSQYYSQCAEPVEQSQAQWILRWMGLLLLVAGTIYWIMPAVRIRRGRLTVFSSEDDAEIMSDLRALCSLEGLSRPPEFLLRALNSSPSGLAFGRLGWYHVVLNGGLVALYYQDRERFRAIVLHELAHLRNNDIDKTYFSLALGMAFVMITLIPLSLGNVVGLIENFGGNIGYVLWQTFSLAIFLPVIYIALTSILRSREAYADARVLMLDPHSSTLRRELSLLSAPSSDPLTRILSLHPSPAWRLKVLDEPHLFFQLSLWDVLLAGLISTFALRELDIFLSILLSPQYENYSVLSSSLLFIPFVVSVAGLGVWQKVFAGQVQGQKLSGFGRSGLSLGIGLLIGMSLSPSAFIDNSIAYADSSAILVAIFNVLLSAIFLASLFLFFRWVALGASVWLETVTNPMDLRRVTFFGLLTTGVLLSCWVGGFYLLNKFGYEFVLAFILSFIVSLQGVSEFMGDAAIWLPILLTAPVLLAAMIWIFPLLSKFRKTSTRLENVLIGDQGTVHVHARIHPKLRPFSALLAGVITAIGFLGFIAILRLLLHFSVDEGTRTAGQWISNFIILQIGLAILVQLILTIVVSAWIEGLGWAHGLFAAFVTGCLIAVGLLGFSEIADCISVFRIGKPLSCSNFLEGNFPFLWGQIIIPGTFISFPAAFIMSWIGSLLRNRTSAPARS